MKLTALVATLILGSSSIALAAPQVRDHRTHHPAPTPVVVAPPPVVNPLPPTPAPAPAPWYTGIRPRPATWMTLANNLEINTAGLLSSDLTARLTSPPEIRDLVWNRGTLTPPGPLRGTLGDEGALHPFSPLSVFDGTGGEGIWRLRLTNLGSLSGSEPTLNSWSLQLKARHCP